MTSETTGDQSKPETIAVSFQKGGTGKTFTSLNVAGGLNARGFDVLLIDLDPQGSLTANVGKRDTYEDAEQLSLDEVMLDVEKWEQINEIIETDHDEFDLIPANATFKGNKTPLDSVSASEKRLGKVLEKVEKDYHYVVCDCPPDLSAYTKNAITADGNVIVPVKPESETIFSMRDQWETLKVLGMMHDMDINYLAYALKYNSTKLTNEKKKVISWCEENTQPLVKVDDRASFDRAKWQQGSIYTHKEALKNDQLPVFDEIVQLVLDKTIPPSYGLDVPTATSMTPEDIREAAEVN